VQPAEQLVVPSRQVEHSVVGVHFEKHAVSLQAHALAHVRYEPHGPLKLPLCQPEP
jgi:hypothetical protein